MPSLVRIPVYEECKLLPAAGIYAVTVVSDQLYSKGMAIIPDSSGQLPELLVQILDNPDAYIDKNTSVLFHKKVYGAVTLSDIRTVCRLNAALSEISELIY